jgi:hypothetical protein
MGQPGSYRCACFGEVYAPFDAQILLQRKATVIRRYWSATSRRAGVRPFDLNLVIRFNRHL